MSAPSSSSDSSHIKKRYAIPAFATAVDAANLYFNGKAPMTKIVTDFVTWIATAVSKVTWVNVQSPSTSSVDLLVARSNQSTAFFTWLATLGLIGYGAKKLQDWNTFTWAALIGTWAMTLTETVSIMNSWKLAITPVVLKAVSDIGQTVANTVPSTASTPWFIDFITSHQTPSAITYALLTICLWMWAKWKNPFAWLPSLNSK
jgi:hypothetical protein